MVSNNYIIDTVPHLDKIFLKLEKKNPKQLKIIYKKLEGIVENPLRFKNLIGPLNHLKRVHIDKNFVLIFSVNKNIILLEDYAHHDKIYRRNK